MWPPGLSRLSPRQLDGAPGAPLAREDFSAGGLLFRSFTPLPHTRVPGQTSLPRQRPPGGSFLFVYAPPTHTRVPPDKPRRRGEDATGLPSLPRQRPPGGSFFVYALPPPPHTRVPRTNFPASAEAATEGCHGSLSCHPLRARGLRASGRAGLPRLPPTLLLDTGAEAVPPHTQAENQTTPTHARYSNPTPKVRRRRRAAH